jgi:hypothetical protein
MKTTFLPKTKPGQWSVILFVIFILFMFLGSYLSKALNNDIEYPNPINSPVLGTSIYLTFIIAGAAFITGIRALLKHKERAIAVYIVMLICGYFALAGSALFIVGMFELLR